MPTTLHRYQHTGELHYITFTCYHRLPYLTPAARDLFESALERARRWYGFYVNAYVVMPEHVHMLISEPERGPLAVALQMLKQIVSRKMHSQTMGGAPFHAPCDGPPDNTNSPGGPPFRAPLDESHSTTQHAKGGPFWQARYYDFNVWSREKFEEKLNYIHQNPVRRGLVERPEDWKWSSFRHLATGEASVVEIESQWTARKRERLGIVPTMKARAS